MDSVVRFLGSVNLISFFAADLYFAFVLSQLKRDHPSIDDCAPEGEVGGGGAPESGYGGLGAGEGGSGSAGGMSAGGTRSYQDTPNDPVSLVIDAARNKGSGEIAALFIGINPRQFFNPSAGGTYNNIDSPAEQQAQQKQRIIHLAVIIASFCAPFFSVLQILFPSSMAWSMFHSPTWLGYLATVPALVLVVIYGSRALRIGTFAEVSKAQWLSLAWFRLDAMVVMGFLILIGWGDWLVSLCLFIVGTYLAVRVMQTERRLQQVVQNTQLLRTELGSGDGEEMSGFSNGAGVVRSALVASEQYGVVGGVGGARSYGYTNPEDEFEPSRGQFGTNSSAYGGADTTNPNSQNTKKKTKDFDANNEPTDSEPEGNNAGARYDNLSAEEVEERRKKSKRR